MGEVTGVCRIDGQVWNRGGYRGKCLVAANSRTQDIGRDHTKVIKGARCQVGEFCADGLPRRTGKGPRDGYARAVAEVSAVLELDDCGLPVRIYGGTQCRIGRAYACSRPGGCYWGARRIDAGRIAGGVVCGACVTAPRDSYRVRDGSRGIGRHTHRDGNWRIGCADRQAVGARAGQGAEVDRPAGAANVRSSETGGQRVHHRNRAARNDRAGIRDDDGIGVAGIALRKVAGMSGRDGQIRGAGQRRGEGLVEAVGRAKEIGCAQTEVIRRSRSELRKVCAHGLCGCAGQGSRHGGGRTIVGGQTIIEPRCCGLPVRINDAVQSHRRTAYAGGRTGGGCRRSGRIDGG